MKKIAIWIFCLLGLNACERPSKFNPSFSPLIEEAKILHTCYEHDIDLDSYSIKYKSDSLLISGFLVKPVVSKKLPTIIYCRGGNRDFGALSLRSLAYMELLASKGFVVLASQLRGNKYSEGQDEFGGKDLNDILQLIKINSDLSFTTNKVGVYGISRGGLNTYQVSRLTDDIDAIAVIGAPTDPRLDFDTRPDMYTGVFSQLVGDTTDKAAYDYRSPRLWAEEINEPALILHGSDDWRVKRINADLIIEQMHKFGNEFEHLIVQGGDHSLQSHEQWRNDTIVNWFNKYLN